MPNKLTYISNMLNSLFRSLARSIVLPLLKRRSPYATKLLPDDPFYVKPRFKRQPMWDDPKSIWPPKSISPTKAKGHTLIQLLETEEMQRIQSQKPFKIPEFRAGDLIEVTKFKSISKGKYTSYKGVVLGLYKKNTINSSFQYIFEWKHRKICFKHKMFSPLIIDVRVVAKGSRKLNAKLYALMNPKVVSSVTTRPFMRITELKRKRADIKRINELRLKGAQNREEKDKAKELEKQNNKEKMALKLKNKQAIVPNVNVSNSKITQEK